MANLDSDIYAGQANINVRYRPEGQKVTGNIVVTEAVWTTATTDASGDKVRWVILPVGAILLPEDCWFFSEGTGGTTVTFTSFGDEGDNARYATADIALTAASSAVIRVTPLTTVLLSRPVIAEASKTLVTVTAGTFPVTAAKKVIGHFEYRMP